MTEDSLTKPKIKDIFCNNCKCETEHTCKGESYRDYPNYVENGPVTYVERIGYRMWICMGCKAGLLEQYYIFDITDNHYKDEDTWTFTCYPKRNEFQKTPKPFNQLKEKLNNIYQELLEAYNNNLKILCAFGIRALIEGICTDKIIVGGDLKSKINNMVQILPKNIVSNLHSIRFIGNEAAHELSQPSDKELMIAIELCEDILNFLYELNYKANALTSARKQRKKSLKKLKL